MSDVLETRRGGAMDDEDVLRWFENADLSQCIVTHSMASGILRMRQQQPAQRKRRVDSGVKRKKADQPLFNSTATEEKS